VHELVKFKMSYSNDFVDEGATVKFRYRASQKENAGVVNGVFKFKIDGVEQSLTTGVMYSDVWLDAEFVVGFGSHRLDWMYTKNNEFGQSDDLSAEIEYIKINGTQTMNKKCQICESGIANKEGNRCIGCAVNEYFDEKTSTCKSCGHYKYSAAGSVGSFSCLDRPDCREEDWTFEVTECVNDQRFLKFKLREPNICMQKVKNSF